MTDAPSHESRNFALADPVFGRRHVNAHEFTMV